MSRILLPTLGLAAWSAPAAAHEATWLAHLHPHGTEAAFAAGTVGLAAVLLWRVLRRRG